MASKRNKRVKGIFKKGKPKFINEDTAKPSERFCLYCKKYRTFKLNKNIGHRECSVCGSRFARRNK